ncbi:MAG: hypothetical protein GY830_08070 [Bacteroidetes bacterium]|nr:hypothetical protein [Bacteroidota bacterium]
MFKNIILLIIIACCSNENSNSKKEKICPPILKPPINISNKTDKLTNPKINLQNTGNNNLLIDRSKNYKEESLDTIFIEKNSNQNDNYNTQKIQNITSNTNLNFKLNKDKIKDKKPNQQSINTHKKKKLNPGNIAIELIPGLGTPKESLYWMREKLKHAGKIFITCRSKCQSLSISKQAKLVEKNLSKILDNNKFKKLIICGHSIGGNIGIEALANISSKYKDKEIEIIIITIGSPLKGSHIAESIDDSFLKLAGIDITYEGLKELKNIDKISKDIKHYLQTIQANLKSKVQIVNISGKSNFIKSTTKILKKINIGKFNIIDFFNKIGKLNIKNVNKFYKILENFEDNDGIVLISSQQGIEVIPNDMKMKRYGPINKLSHIDFYDYIPKFISNYFNKEEPEIKSDFVIKIINDNITSN